jgi:hypothetical protein
MKDAQILPDCDISYRLEEISRIQVSAKRERDAREKRAAAEDCVWERGRLVPRKH